MAYKFVVVGGGTAGWLSALYLRYKDPEAEITLVESEAIGILGAGEGTTPTFTHLMDELNIPLSMLVSETSSTIKNGIKFTNWQGKGESYYHGFTPNDEVGLNAFDSKQYMSGTSLLFSYAKASDKDFSEYNYITKLSEEGKVPFHVHPDYTEDAILPNPIFKYFYDANYAVHFDAVVLADFFKKLAVEDRKVIRIEGKVISETKNLNGDIASLTLESGEIVEGDFFIDCTGFAKRFIGKSYESEWVSHSDHLTVDSAMPFFLPINPNDISPHTESTAMKYGWIWKIPLQHRYGCGYVFDSNYLSDEEAKKEIVEFLGEEPVWPREQSFKFQPGYYKTPWVNNCLAVGLSSGFIEPLEATSIWVTIIYLKNALRDMSLVKDRNSKYIKEFNEKASGVSQDVFEFVYLHYMGGRKDTEFWKHYQSKKNMPKRLKDMLAKWEYRLPVYDDYEDSIFSLESWLAVSEGVGKINTKSYKKSFEGNNVPQFIEDDYKFLMQVQGEYLSRSMKHSEFLTDLKSSPQTKPV